MDTVVNNSAISLNSSAAEPLQYDNQVRVIYYYTFRSIESVLAFGGNLLTVLAVITAVELRTPTAYLIVNLAVADMASAVLTPLSIYVELSPRTLLWHQVCIFKEVLYTITGLENVVSLFFIALDRLTAVVTTLKYKMYVTCKRVRVVLVIAWLVSIIHCCLVFYVAGKGSLNMTVCLNIHVVTKSVFFYAILVPFATLILSAALVYFVIGLVIWKEGRATIANHGGTFAANVSRRHRELAKTMLVIVSVYLLLTTPTTVFSLLARDRRGWFNHLYYISLIMWHGNACVNPFIYAWKVRQFRTAFRRLLALPRNAVGDNA